MICKRRIYAKIHDLGKNFSSSVFTTKKMIIESERMRRRRREKNRDRGKYVHREKRSI